ncbi:MAG: hypothetical protein IJP46_10200 [Prevotella sp.]|nr:hypothetical protein [Prevotella sp.]
MKVRYLLTAASFVGLMLVSCSTKQHAISQLENFSYELRDHSASYGIDEWQQAGEKFVEIRKKIAKHEQDYTSAEKARIGELEGQCARYMVQGAKQGLLDRILGVGTELMGIIKSIMGFPADSTPEQWI